MGRDGRGVTEHNGKVRITFLMNGKRMRPMLDLAYTPNNIKAAEKMLARIKKDIQNGVFNYATEFPGSRAVKSGTVPKQDGARGKTVGEAIQAFLDTKADKSANTRKGYRNAGEVWKRLFGADTLLGEMSAEHVETTIGLHPFKSGKLKNDYLIVLRGACRLAHATDKTWHNPMDGVENAPKQKAKVLPLSALEMVKVLKYMHTHFDERVHAYFVWMFETGERPEEAIAHEWGDVDWDAKTVHVCRARTLGITGPVKTHEVRDIDLSPAALDALRVMMRHTHRAKSPELLIFMNPKTGRPWHDSRSQHDHYWKPTLAALHIQPRRSYNTRHTYATLRLMVGAVPSYISRQLGHETATMLFDTYAKWLDADKDERARVMQLVQAKIAAAQAKVEAAMAKV
jgi:integrase